MDLVIILLIALGLSMDCFAVSITSGALMKKLRLGYALKMAFFFGFFQAIMPVFGWLGGVNLEIYISSFDHWVAFGLLVGVGCKMIYESMGSKDQKKNSFELRVLLVLAIATSIDAFAVGLSLAFLETMILLPILIIGITTFILSFAGVWIGSRFGRLFEKKIGIAGGLILIAIGVRILLEHLLA